MNNEVLNSEDPKWWRRIVERYEVPHLPSAIWQIASAIIPYLLLWYAMTITVSYSYLLTLLLAVPTACFLIRIFIISHDCGHGSYFANPKANTFWGAITGFLSLTPFKYWRMEHAHHHGSSGNLDRRGIGDIWTMTVAEYKSSSFGRRLQYRLYRNPLVIFGIGPFFMFTVAYRFTTGATGSDERWSVYLTNLALLTAGLLMMVLIGVKAYLMIFIPVLAMAASIGTWLFYVQHQFEGVYWERDDKWDYLKQAMEGSSFYKLPAVLEWFSGNIGYHHIHHLSHRIPNYNLPRCHKENELFRNVPEITLWRSFKSATFRLWDEDRRQLVGFSVLRRTTA